MGMKRLGLYRQAVCLLVFAAGVLLHQTAAAQEHPRMFFTGDEIATLRNQALTTHQDIAQPVLDYADSQIGTTPLASYSGTDLDVYRDAGNQMIPFAFAYVITGDPKYLTLTRDYLVGYAGWEHWGDEGGLDRCLLGHNHMLMGNCLAYDWVYDDLSTADRDTIRTNLAQRANETYEASSGGWDPLYDNWWHQSYIQNHHSTARSALGIAAMVLEGEDARAGQWLNETVAQMARSRYIWGGTADGTWHEGIPYQNYMLTMSLAFFHNLKKYKGADIIPHTYLEGYSHWRVYNSLADSSRFALSFSNFDWSWASAYAPQNILRFIASEHNDGHAEWAAQHIINNETRLADVYSAPWYVFEFLYYDASVAAQPPDDLPLNRTFTDLEGVIWRTGWGADDLVFGLKSGAFGGRFSFENWIELYYPFELDDVSFNNGHDHADAGTFYLYKGNVDLTSEKVGVGENVTSYHNTLLVDGQGQYIDPDTYNGNEYWDGDPDLFRGVDGKLDAVYETPNFNYLAANPTDRYRYRNPVDGKPDAYMVDEFKRHVLFVRPEYFVMVDNVRAATPHQYDWVCHFSNSVSVEGDWIRGDAPSNQIIGIKVLSPAGFANSIGDDGKPYIRVRPPADVADTRFITVLYPTDTANWGVKPDASSLGDTDEAAGVRVSLSGLQEDHLFRYGSQSEVAVGEYLFDAAVASVVKDSTGNLQRIFMGQGTEISDDSGSRLLLEARSEIIVEVDYNGTALDVHSDDANSLKVYAPGTDPRQVTFNGNPAPAFFIGDYLTVSRPVQFVPKKRSSSGCTVGRARGGAATGWITLMVFFLTGIYILRRSQIESGHKTVIDLWQERS